MPSVSIIVTGYADDHPPGFVACKLTDAEGRDWLFIEKVPVVSRANLGPSSTYPRQVWISCEVLSRRADERGREVVEIDTEQPWGIQSTEGVSRFWVHWDQLLAWPPTDLKWLRICVELGFMSPAMVAEWALSVVDLEEAPAGIYCDLALAANKTQASILEILGDYRDAARDTSAWEHVLAWVAGRVRARELDAGHVIRRIWALASVDQADGKLYHAFLDLEDQYALARDGIHGSFEQTTARLLEELDRLGQPGALSSDGR